MLFLEQWFWLFAAVAVPVFWLCPQRLKVYWLLAASAVFHYHFAGPAGMTPIILLASFTYVVARGVSGQSAGRSFTVCWISIIAALIFYKYSAFLLRVAAPALRYGGVAPPDWMINWRSPAAPLGISFFTFEFLHYLYEIRVRGHTAVRNPVHFALFAIFFPTLAAGPIKRFPDFVPQLADLSNPRPAAAYYGALRVVRGLFKKVCLADLLVECIRVFEDVPHYNATVVAALAVMQGLRIYFDFAGYTDIALGLAAMVNLRVPENFDRPYWSTSLQEFWRRWHMSLSSWIRDYIYIPLGGNRVHRVFNLLAAMIICGLWHGAAFNFAVWGLYHGTGLAIETGVRRWRPTLFTAGRSRQLLGWAICYTFVTYGWLIFFYPIEVVFKMTKEALWWHHGF